MLIFNVTSSSIRTWKTIILLFLIFVEYIVQTIIIIMIIILMVMVVIKRLMYAFSDYKGRYIGP